MDFSNSLIRWYLQNKRDLPWRNTTNPYQIWLSEIILQQTRVAQGLPFFNNFITAFPTVFDLASAPEEQVLKLWQGLGYYSRARNLHATAKYIADDCNGVFPDNFAALKKLKGIGDYTAAAIASFCYQEVVPVVDGNVYRVLARIFDVQTDIALPSAKKEFFSLAQEVIDQDKPDIFNQAIMEFGALQCIPKSPDCTCCIFNTSCLALKNNSVGSLPVKLKKNKITKRYFNYIIFKDQNQNTLVSKRVLKGIWQNLYEFPLIETQSNADIDYIIAHLQETPLIDNPIKSILNYSKNVIQHKLSHQHLNIQFWQVTVDHDLDYGINYETLLKYPFPIVIFNFIENHW